MIMQKVAAILLQFVRSISAFSVLSVCKKVAKNTYSTMVQKLCKNRV